MSRGHRSESRKRMTIIFYLWTYILIYNLEFIIHSFAFMSKEIGVESWLQIYLDSLFGLIKIKFENIDRLK